MKIHKTTTNTRLINVGFAITLTEVRVVGTKGALHYTIEDAHAVISLSRSDLFLLRDALTLMLKEPTQ